jgi:Kinesin motor domain
MHALHHYSIRESATGEIYVDNLSRLRVHSAAEALQVLEQGQTNRITASTSLNAHSSRSHAAVLVYVEQRALQVQQTEVPAVSATVTRSVTAVTAT